MTKKRAGPRGADTGDIQGLSDCKRCTRRGQFVPPRMGRTLPPLFEVVDVDFAVRLRSAIRRAINRGQPDVAARFAGVAAELVRRRGVG